MKSNTAPAPGGVPARYLAYLAGDELLLKLTWEDWLAIEAPFGETGFAVREVQARYSRNGYDWDIHGRLYTPEAEADRRAAFVIFPGGSGNEHNVDLTPDGRPGLARVLASQGFTTLSLSYTGLYAPGGVWKKPAATRLPHYLLDRELPEAEILDRNLKCTFNVILQGSGLLVDQHLAGRRVIAYGYSTGGPMAAHLHRFVSAASIQGLAGFGSGGPDGWRKEWREKTGLEKEHPVALDHVMRRTSEGLRSRGYQVDPELCPWGTLDRYIEICEPLRPHINIGLCINQHSSAVGALRQYAAHTGLPEEEYLDYLQDPDPAWLKSAGVLLLVGENDKAHWVVGDRLQDKVEMFMAAKYRDKGARSHVVRFPRYGHNGYCERHCEKIPYLWLWAHRQGFFERR